MEEEISLIDYIKVIIKRWKLILAIFLITLLIGGVVSFTMPKTFRAQAVVKIGRWVTSEKEALENVSETVRVLNLKGNFPNVEISSPAKTYLVTIKALAQTPEQALNDVNSVIDSILARHQKAYQEAALSLEKEIAGAEKEINDLQEKIRKEETTLNQTRAQIIRGYLLRLTEVEGKLAPLKARSSFFKPTQTEVFPALLPQSPIKPNIKLNLLVVAVVGIFLGVFVAFVWEWYIAQTKKS